ncbi:hypothetical protein RN001_000403 [Aquatica leii]|uniref:HAT C-terminal dimerisation domain-containing protein n=1 Tax=Aquatica leii TaxID=1421715 RepID=A0AAN7SJ53_9COLE|nr:hypothetical protein RN001_000403 [Aquatica leii]
MHCATHKLNLVVVKACSLPSLRCEMVEKVINTLEKYRETKLEAIYQGACLIVKSLDIPIQAPRTVNRSTHRSNIDGTDVKKYYRQDKPYLNGFLPFIDFVLGQLRSRFYVREQLRQTAAEAHQEANEFFPNVKILLQLLATIPVFTCNAERCFSSLKHIKTDLRTTMVEDRLNGLAAIYIHRNISRGLQPVEAVEEFITSL